MRDDKEERATLKAVHISDVHLDFKYKAGTLANCGEIICCRAAAGWPTHSGDKAAGVWGSPFDCDVPPQTYQLFLDYIVNEI